MATYAEIFGLGNNSDLRNKVAVAASIKAQNLIDGATPTTNEITWADETLKNPRARAEQLLNYVLAANSDNTVTQIETASDAQIQTNVDAAVNALIAGMV